jgi:hypothetical protein
MSNSEIGEYTIPQEEENPWDELVNRIGDFLKMKEGLQSPLYPSSGDFDTQVTSLGQSNGWEVTLQNGSVYAEKDGEVYNYGPMQEDFHLNQLVFSDDDPYIQFKKLEYGGISGYLGESDITK